MIAPVVTTHHLQSSSGHHSPPPELQQKPANPGSVGKMAIKMQTDVYAYFIFEEKIHKFACLISVSNVWSNSEHFRIKLKTKQTEYLSVCPPCSRETTLIFVLPSAGVDFTDTVSTLSSDLTRAGCCGEGFAAVSSDTVQFTDDVGVMLSANLSPPVLSDLAESFSERSERAEVRFSTAPWATLFSRSTSAHHIIIYRLSAISSVIIISDQ